MKILRAASLGSNFTRSYKNMCNSPYTCFLELYMSNEGEN